MTLRAPAKLNLCLYLGAAPGRRPARDALAVLPADARRPDRVSSRRPTRDEVVCPGVEGPNLVAAALAALRARGWDAPPVRVEIEKRIPVAAGLGGGSADAAAVLRHLAATRSRGARRARRRAGGRRPVAARPGFALVGGAGEVVEPLPRRGEFAVVLVPAERGLSSTAEVYAEADRLGLGRDPDELDAIGGASCARQRAGARRRSSTASSGQRPARAALSLRPEIAEALVALEEAGASVALVTGSGPTAFGLFEDIAAADRAAAALPPRFAGAIVSAPRDGSEEAALVQMPADEERVAQAAVVIAALVVAAGSWFISHQFAPTSTSRSCCSDIVRQAGRLDVSARRAVGVPRDGRVRRAGAPGRDGRHPRRRGRRAGRDRRSCSRSGSSGSAPGPGDSVSFLLGRRLGREFVMRHGPKVRITRERFAQVEDYFRATAGRRS